MGRTGQLDFLESTDYLSQMMVVLAASLLEALATRRQQSLRVYHGIRYLREPSWEVVYGAVSSQEIQIERQMLELVARICDDQRLGLLLEQVRY